MQAEIKTQRKKLPKKLPKIEDENKKERNKLLAESLMKIIQSSPKYKYDCANTPQILYFENSLYFRGKVINCAISFGTALNHCYVWCVYNKCKTIYFFINSSGGDKKVKDTCVKKIERLKKIWIKSDIKIECIVLQFCCSAAVELALECDTIKIYKNGQMGIHYPSNIKYVLNEDGTAAKSINSENPILEEDKIKIENYYESKLHLDKETVCQLLAESKLLNTDEILKYNLASEVIDTLPPQFKELRKLIK